MRSVHHSGLILLCLSSLVVAQNQACSPEKTSDPTPLDAHAKLLIDVGPKVILPTLEEFSLSLEALQEELTFHRENLEQSSSPIQQDILQEKWIATMDIWQQLEVMQIGPAGNSITTIAGLDIRDEVYSWPLVNPCRVDQRTATLAFEDEAFFTDNLVNAYGLDALEHLLFAGSDSVCPSQVSPVSDGLWAELDTYSIQDRRLAYSQKIVSEIQEQKERLISSWSPEGDNFSQKLAGDPDSPYTSQTEALNAVYHALFYFEKITKDQKLAIPLGLRDCESDCTEYLEHLQSETSLAAIHSNLIGFSLLFNGGTGYGFDDLLIELGHSDLQEELQQHLDQSLALIAEVDVPLSVLITERPELRKAKIGA